jgi:two-component system, NtrC family, nitrogen regulation sensor histidine kinase NtrY
MATTDALDSPGSGFPGLLRAVSRSTLLAVGIGAFAVLSGIATYVIIAGLVPYQPSRATLIWLLLVNLTVVLALGALVGWRLTRFWVERRSGVAGARLQARLVGIFSMIAVVPVILVAIFAAVTLNLGIEQWFSTHVKDAIAGSVNLASHYEAEHEQTITRDALEIAYAVENDPQLYGPDQRVNQLFYARLADLAKDHDLRAFYVFGPQGQLLSHSDLRAVYVLDPQGRVVRSLAQKPLPPLPPPKASDFAAAAQGAIFIDANSKIGVLRALIGLPALNAYLQIVRSVDPQAFGYYQRMTNADDDYNRLDANRAKLQLVFAALYGVVSLLVLLAAIWLGLWAANSLVNPISRLIGAAERVAGGDLKAQVMVDKDDDEIATLGRAFNRMTAQLDAQRTELIEASHQIDARRRFTEAVLAGVSAGVIGLDGDGHITIVNRAAARLLNAAPEELESRHYSEAVPELAGLIRRALQEPIGRAGGEAVVKRSGSVRNLSVQVDSENGPYDAGYIVTFDDITDLVSAQRTAAWADVARRIAHEIKNPLTPIQLSAERLKRKYGNEVTSDPEIFRQCTDTIIRQVGDIGRMVDEFSSFARMPTPTMRRENAQELLHQAVFLQRVANPQIAFETKAPVDPLYFECDGRLVSQALTNVLKNATEAIAAREAGGNEGPGRIAITLDETGERLVYRIADNGVGLPPQHRHRLTEPYVTTRAKGTGLGLAIVKKILEDHGGEVALADREDVETGAEVRLSFPLRQKNVREAKPDTRVGVV